MSKPITVHTLESIKARCIEEGDCWLWQGYITNKTPQMAVNGKTMRPVRRVVLELAGAVVKPGAYLSPSCDNPSCVCPDHVVQRSPKEHMSAMGKKAGEGVAYAQRIAKLTETRRAQCKLTIEDARAIRQAEGTHKQIADRYGVNKALIGRIIRGQQWKDHANPFGGLMR